MSTFAIAGLAARPAFMFFVTVMADEVPVAAALQLPRPPPAASGPSQRRRSPLPPAQPAEEAAMAHIAFRRDAVAGAVALGGGGGGRDSLPPLPILGLELGRHLGSGSFGNVFLGKLNGSPVDVKAGFSPPISFLPDILTALLALPHNSVGCVTRK